MDKLPETLQLLPSTKQREPDAAIRLILVETLGLLATTRACREAMRLRGVYEVIKVAHLAETTPKVAEHMARLVDLLMREEGPDTAIEEIEDGEGEGSGKLESATSTIDAEGKVASEGRPSLPMEAQAKEEEDEDEMVIEV